MSAWYTEYHNDRQILFFVAIIQEQGEPNPSLEAICSDRSLVGTTSTPSCNIPVLSRVPSILPFAPLSTGQNAPFPECSHTSRSAKGFLAWYCLINRSTIVLRLVGHIWHLDGWIRAFLADLFISDLCAKGQGPRLI